MKKRFLLLALPALMLISSCGNSSSGMSRATKIFADDCLAHEEAFGEAGELIPFKGGIKRVAPVAPQTIGYQVSGDKTKIRFVAEVENPGSITTATRTRNVYDSSTGVKLRDQSTVSPSGYYETINDGGNVRNAKSGYGFVVYTLTNIPAANTDDYVAVELSLTNETGTTNSKICVGNADETKDFCFESSASDYFAVVNGNQTVEPVSRNQGGNHATFNMNLEEDDTVLFVDYSNNQLHLYGIEKSQDNSVHFISGDNESLKAKYDASYTFYVSSNNLTDNYIYVEAVVPYKKYYLRPNENWKSAGARFALNIQYKVSENPDWQRWFDMTQIGDSGVYECTATLDPAYNANILVFARMNGGTSENNWDNKWNDTGALSLQATNDLYSVPDGWWDCGGDGSYWSVYSA